MGVKAEADRTERGLRLVDHAYQLRETKTDENERADIGKWKRRKTHQTTKAFWQSYKTDKEDAFIISKPRSFYHLKTKLFFQLLAFVFGLNCYTYDALFVLRAILSLQSAGISSVFQAGN